MKHKTSKRLTIWVVVMLFSVIACQSLSGGDAPPSTSASTLAPGGANATPTVNLTLTAIFAPLGTLPPEATEEPAATEDDEDGDGEDPAPTATLTPISASAAASPTLAPLIAGQTVTPIYLDYNESATGVPDEGRPGPSANAVFQVVPPVIDGDPSDWASIVYAAENVVFGKEFHAGKADLSADFKLGWDAEFLYISVTVRDSKFVQNATGAQLYQGDGLEILIDTDLAGDFNDTYISADDFQIGFSPGNAQEGDPPEAYIWTPREEVGTLHRVILAAKLTGEGYVIEVGIPWFVIGVAPANGLRLGFLLSVSDNDSVNSNQQQTVVSFASSRALHNPTTWRDLHLIFPGE